MDCEQKAQSRLQVLENTLIEYNDYCGQLQATRVWLAEVLEKLSDPVPMTLSVDELNATRQQHSVSATD